MYIIILQEIGIKCRRGIRIEYNNFWRNSYDKEIIDVMRNSYKMIGKKDDVKRKSE